MLKTIKKTKLIRIDELVSYVRENKKTLFENREKVTFKNKNNVDIIFEDNGKFIMSTWVSVDDLFEVEIGEEITENMEFNRSVVVLNNGSVIAQYKTTTIKTIKEFYGTYSIKQIHALIEGKLELIWESED